MLGETDKLLPNSSAAEDYRVKSKVLYWKSKNETTVDESGSVGRTEYEDSQVTSLEEAEDAYDAFAHRTVDHPTSNFETSVNLLKGNIGIGILAMPGAFKNAGLIVGSVGLVILYIICLHTLHLLLGCANNLAKLSRTPSLSFAKVGEMSFKYGPPALRPFSRTARGVTSVFLCLGQMGLCCVYCLFVATNLQLLVLEYFEVNWSIKVYLAIILFPLICLNWIRNLKFLAPVMTFASLCLVVGLGIIFYYLFRDIRPSHKGDSKWVSSGLDHLPLYFGTAMCAFEGIAMVLPFENNMRNPKDFGGWNGVLNSTMLIVLLLNIAVGFFGYLVYGEAAGGSITLNLPVGDRLASSVRILISLSIFLSYPLQFYVFVRIAWPPLRKMVPVSLRGATEYVFRTTFVLFTFALAETVPNLSLGISLVGSFCLSTLGLVLPPIFALCINWTVGYGTLRWKMWKDFTLLTFGVVASVVATYANLLEIISAS